MRLIIILGSLSLAACLDLDASHYRFSPGGAADGGEVGTGGTQLAGLSPSEGALSPDFAPTTLRYTVTVSPSTQTVTLTPRLVDPAATVEVQGTRATPGLPSAPVALVDGAGTVEVVVRNGTDSTRYQVDFVAQLPAQKARFEGASHFGTAVSLSRDTLVVGAYGDATATGLVTVYVREGAAWNQQQQLRASNADQMDQFGRSVAIDGNTLIIGAPGEDSAATTVNGNQNDNTASNSGAAYVFVRDGTQWTQQAYLKPTDAAPGLNFGWSVSISGDVVAIGARGAAGAGTLSGAAYVFTRSGVTWTQQQALVASNAAANAVFGTSVSLSGSTLAVGASNEASLASQSGAVYVFVHGASWTEQAHLKASDASAYALFGNSVSLDGDSLAVGSFGSGGSLHHHQGSAYVFVRNNNAWTEQARVTPLIPTDDDEFGWSVAVLGNRLAIGAWQDGSSSTGVNGSHDAATLYAGAGYLFSRSGTAWSQRAFLKASVTSADAYLGASVALMPNFLALGGDTQVCIFSSP